MNVSEFITEFNLQRQNLAVPAFWSSAEIKSYLNSAMDEACERALLIEDSTTADCCQIDLTAGESVYPLHSSVIKVKRVSYNGQAITETSVESLDDTNATWEAQTGAPTEYVVNETSIRVYPTPTAESILVASTINLTVYRRQLTPLSGNTDTPEIPAVYHLRLMPWVYRCALLKNDTDTFDGSKAAEQEAIFERSFGVRPDANVQRKRRDKRSPTVVSSMW